MGDRHKRLKTWLKNTEISADDKSSLLELLLEEYKIDVKSRAAFEVVDATPDEGMTEQFNEIKKMVLESLVSQQTLEEKLNREHVQDSQEHATLIEMVRRICYALNVSVPTVVKLNPLGYRKRKANEMLPANPDQVPIVNTLDSEDITSTEPQTNISKNPTAGAVSPSSSPKEAPAEEVVTFPITSLLNFQYFDKQIQSNKVFRDSLLEYLKGLLPTRKPDNTATVLSSLFSDEFIYQWYPITPKDKTSLFRTAFVKLVLEAWTSDQYNPIPQIRQFVDQAWGRQSDVNINI